MKLINIKYLIEVYTSKLEDDGFTLTGIWFLFQRFKQIRKYKNKNLLFLFFSRLDKEKQGNFPSRNEKNPGGIRYRKNIRTAHT